MKLWGNKTSRYALIAAGIGLVAALPAIGQESPESLLPPGFGDPAPAPPPRPRPNPAPQQPSDSTTAPNATTGSLVDAETGEALGDIPEDAVIDPSLMPHVAAHYSTYGSVGPLLDIDGGLGNGAYGHADGRMLSDLMRKLDAPLPSRWLSILLRRSLLSNVPTPRGVYTADWAAERAWLLLRMGEADSARLLVQAVDVPQYTPKMNEVAMQTSLALGDPAGMCPIADQGAASSASTSWILAKAICAGLAGEPGTASAALDQARRTQRGGRNIDLLLAEKVVGAGINGRRAVTIEWNGVDQLTTWRYGLASAVAVPIPETLFATTGRQIQGWRARAPMLPNAERIAVARNAAILGVLSSEALVDVYGEVYDHTDPSEIAGTPPVKLREAYQSADTGERIAALREIWGEGDVGDARFANLILTSHASASIAIDADYSSDVSHLVGAMLTAGLDRRAAMWSNIADDASNQDGWAMLALGAPRVTVPISKSRVTSYMDDVDPEKGRLLLAGLAGLGRLSAQDAAAIAQDQEFDLMRQSKWSHLLETAVNARQPGTVVLFAAIGMQTSQWKHVPPEHLYHIVSALRRVGLEPEARMIAAEAIART